MSERATLTELLHGLARVAPPNEVLIDHPVNGYWRSVPFGEWLAQVRIAINFCESSATNDPPTPSHAYPLDNDGDVGD